ncbi:MAG: type II CRISPR-associated endonuclease Cas1 [Clostridia bacterium]|jgi:CRISPR-associated protein Cas1|nr:type II CRISPR-associated endonuclease Cas1 [Clostridia bacterium]
MGFRIVIINSRCKLETRLNYLVVRGEKEKKIYINEINTLIVQSTAVSLTAALLSVLVENNVKIIFCDEKSNPQSELIPYYGAHNTTKRYKWQFCWGNDIKEKLWQQIIKQKIFNQSELLKRRGFDKEAQALLQYAEDVREGDSSNREGHAAKVYFNCILPIGISRHGGGFLNGCLNYGYACLLSAFNREIVAAGLLTQLGIWHDNEFNQFNFSCDLMEPFRPIVDEAALSLEEGDEQFKRKMANVLNFGVVVDGIHTTLDLAIRRNVRSVLSVLESGDISQFSFPREIVAEYEL